MMGCEGAESGINGIDTAWEGELDTRLLQKRRVVATFILGREDPAGQGAGDGLGKGFTTAAAAFGERQGCTCK